MRMRVLVVGEMHSRDEPLIVDMRGVKGCVQRNVIAFLAFPRELMKGEVVDTFWLERFRQ